MNNRPRFARPLPLLALAASLSFLLYLISLVLPYNLFAHVHEAPISMPEIAHRRPLPAAVFLLTFLALFALYVLAYRLCRRYPQRRLVPLILLSGLAMVTLLSLVYPIGAGDVVDYVSHGEELAFFGQNPLAVPPAHIPGNVFARYSAFRNVPPNYGPLWMWISGLVVATVGRQSLALNLLGFKAVAIAAYLVQGLVIYTLLRRRDPDLAPAGLLFFAWNPLLLYEFGANGHNDATMMAFALVGILLWELRQPYLMVTALTLSFLIKIPTAPLLPLFLLSAARQRGAGRPFWTTLVGGGLLSLALIGAAYLSLPAPLTALTNLSDRSGLFTHSLPAIVRLTLRLAGVGADNASAITRTTALLALAAWYALQVKRSFRHPDQTLSHAYQFTAFLLLFVTPWFQPWYITWLIPLAALLPSSIARPQSGLFSFSVIGAYVVYGFVWFWIPHTANWGNCLGINLMAVGTTYLLPWAYTAWQGLRTAHSTSSG